MAKKNLFANAKKATPKKAKKDDKITVLVGSPESAIRDEDDAKNFADSLDVFAKLKAEIAEKTAELKMAEEVVKSVGIEEYIKLIEENKKNVGTFNLHSSNGGSVMVCPTKKYIKVDDDGIEYLKETYGEKIIDEETTYSFDTNVLMRNMDIISELIMNCEDISDEDKENLIVQKDSYSIKSDTLDQVYELAKKAKKDVVDVLNDIQPVISNKYAKAGK